MFARELQSCIGRYELTYSHVLWIVRAHGICHIPIGLACVIKTDNQDRKISIGTKPILY